MQQLSHQHFDNKFVYPVCTNSDRIYAQEEYNDNWFAEVSDEE